MWNLWLMRTPSCQCLVSCKTHCKVHTFAQSPSPVRIGPSCYQATIEDHCSDNKRPGQYTGLSIYHVCLRNLLYFLIKNSFLFEKHYSVHSNTLHSANYNGHFYYDDITMDQAGLLRLASATTVHWWTKLGRNSRYFFDPIIDTQTQPVLLYIACWSQSLFLSSSYCKLSSLKSQSYSVIYIYLELNLFVFCIQFCSVKMLTISSYVIVFFNPLNPKIKSRILICCPYSFPTEVVGRRW